MQVLGSSDLEATYAALSRTEFTWEELQQRPLPPGVDPARIEAYLSTDAFQVFFKFYAQLLMKSWWSGCIIFLLGPIGQSICYDASHQIFSRKSSRWRRLITLPVQGGSRLRWRRMRVFFEPKWNVKSHWRLRCFYFELLHTYVMTLQRGAHVANMALYYCKILVDNCLLKMMSYWCRWCRHVICSIGDGEHAE